MAWRTPVRRPGGGRAAPGTCGLQAAGPGGSSEADEEEGTSGRVRREARRGVLVGWVQDITAWRTHWPLGDLPGAGHRMEDLGAQPTKVLLRPLDPWSTGEGNLRRARVAGRWSPSQPRTGASRKTHPLSEGQANPIGPAQSTWPGPLRVSARPDGCSAFS